MWTIDKLLTVCRDEWPALTWSRTRIGVEGRARRGYGGSVAVYRTDWTRYAQNGPRFRTVDAIGPVLYCAGSEMIEAISRPSQLRAALRLMRYALPDAR